jgi:thiol-disulfide isomerase/thioredoxin
VAFGVLGTACERRSNTPEPEYPALVVISELNVQERDCESCTSELETALLGLSGVVSAIFHPDTSSLTLAYDPNVVGAPDFIAKAQELGFEAFESTGNELEGAPVEFDSALDVAQLSENGDSVEVADFVVEGKTTVFSFHAFWCDACIEVDRFMLELLRQYEGLALRTIDVADANSPIARRYLEENADLPYVMVFGPKGELIDAIRELNPERLESAIKVGLAQPESATPDPVSPPASPSTATEGDEGASPDA